MKKRVDSFPMSRRQWIWLAAGALGGPETLRGQAPRHSIVYKESGKFGGWPANCGLWSWRNEIVVGFLQRIFEQKPEGHAMRVDIAPVQMQARTTNGGETWSIERPPGLAMPAGIQYEHFKVEKGPAITDCPGGINFLHPDFAFTARMAMNPPGESWFCYSLDRCVSWEGPFNLPNFGHTGTAARTDYLVNGKHDMFVFLTVAKADGEQGRVALVQTQDGAKTWKLVSYVGSEPQGDDYAIMPSTVRLDAMHLLTSIRHRGFIETYRSRDNGATWQYDGRPVPKTGKGNPGCLTRLRDGRLALTYGYRAVPFGIRALLSSDGGKTWGSDVILRQDGGSEDIGYPLSVQRPDGKMLTVYYYNTDLAEERYIATTLWDPRQ